MFRGAQAHHGNLSLGFSWAINGRLLDAPATPSKTPCFTLLRVQQSRTTIYDQKRYLL